MNSVVCWISESGAVLTAVSVSPQSSLPADDVEGTTGIHTSVETCGKTTISSGCCLSLMYRWNSLSDGISYPSAS